MDVTSYLLGKGQGGGEINLQDKEVTITQNGTQTITKDSGYDGLNSVEVTTSVPQPSGTINITENGNNIDVSSYASANVSVGGGPETLSELNEIFKQYLENVSKNQVSDYYTQDNVTLYTPNEDCKYYLIYFDSPYYYIIWTKTCYGCLNEGYLNRPAFMNLGEIGDELDLKSTYSFNGYKSETLCTTIEKCLNLIKNNQMTYSSYGGKSPGSNKTLVYTNMPFFQIVGGVSSEVEQTSRISPNETIEVIS